MAAELPTPALISAAAAMLSFGSKAVPQPPAVSVVNWAVVYALLPLAQLVLTLQSYVVDAAKELRFADNDVVPVAALIQVPEALVL